MAARRGRARAAEMGTRAKDSPLGGGFGFMGEESARARVHRRVASCRHYSRIAHRTGKRSGTLAGLGHTVRRSTGSVLDAQATPRSVGGLRVVPRSTVVLRECPNGKHSGKALNNTLCRAGLDVNTGLGIRCSSPALSGATNRLLSPPSRGCLTARVT